MAKKIQLTKDNWRKFTKPALMPGYDKKHVVSQAVVTELQKNTQLLQECRRMYSSLQDFRDRRDECIKYFYGDQLSRLVPDPDGCGQTT